MSLPSFPRPESAVIRNSEHMTQSLCPSLSLLMTVHDYE